MWRTKASSWMSAHLFNAFFNHSLRCWERTRTCISCFPKAFVQWKATSDANILSGHARTESLIFHTIVFSGYVISGPKQESATGLDQTKIINSLTYMCTCVFCAHQGTYEPVWTAVHDTTGITTQVQTIVFSVTGARIKLHEALAYMSEGRSFSFCIFVSYKKNTSDFYRCVPLLHSCWHARLSDFPCTMDTYSPIISKGCWSSSQTVPAMRSPWL